MGITWGYVWGIWWWRCTGANMNPQRLKTDFCEVPQTSDGEGGLTLDHARELRERGLSVGIPQTIPMDVVTTGARRRVHNRSFSLHMFTGSVAVGSICNAGQGNYVSSPEFCLFQIARYIRRGLGANLESWQFHIILIELCCEFCGTYSKQNTPKGYKNRAKPLTSVMALVIYCGRMAHVLGTDRLRTALAWTLDGLNSPMETVLYLLLCLPPYWGGLGLMRPFSNYVLDVPKRLWEKTPLRHIKPDLYWPEFKLIVEFNGKGPHEGHEVEDQERMEIAQDMGYRVVTFRKEDLYDRRKFLAKAQSVAGYLGQEMPEQKEQFIQLQNTLFNMLLHHERWV